MLIYSCFLYKKRFLVSLMRFAMYFFRFFCFAKLYSNCAKAKALSGLEYKKNSFAIFYTDCKRMVS